MSGPVMPPKQELRSQSRKITRPFAAAPIVEPESQLQQPPAKGRKGSYPSRSKTPPEFWDKLSRVPLCRRALREFNRRAVRPVASKRRVKRDVEDSLVKQLKLFARRGGPDLRSIRGVSFVSAVEKYADFYSTQNRNHKTK